MSTLAATKLRVTRMMQLLPTQWVVATPTRVGTLTPDGVGRQMHFIENNSNLCKNNYY
jgi:hypothetical protein